jgi:hypothetical protein
MSTACKHCGLVGDHLSNCPLWPPAAYPEWLREAASKGGSAATAAKARAARRNGRKGGRPKKPIAERKKVAAFHLGKIIAKGRALDHPTPHAK